MKYVNQNKISFHKKKDKFDHQIEAVEEVRKGLLENDRGKLIMACGTGKTFTSLCIAEEIFGVAKKILYLVPSLALMSQTIRDWKNDSKNDFIAFSVCSDAKVGKKKLSEDSIDIQINELAFPATTNPAKLSDQIKQADQSKMIVIFSTYQSIDVISAHNTTLMDHLSNNMMKRTDYRSNLAGENDSNFVKITRQRRKKDLYDCHPRIYAESATMQEEEGKVNLFPMDKEIYEKHFSIEVSMVEQLFN